MKSCRYSFLYENHSSCGPSRLTCMLKGKIGEREGSLSMSLNNFSLIVLVKARTEKKTENVKELELCHNHCWYCIIQLADFFLSNMNKYMIVYYWNSTFYWSNFRHCHLLHSRFLDPGFLVLTTAVNSCIWQNLLNCQQCCSL